MCIELVAFDLDGTLYFGNQVAEDAINTCNSIKDRGIQVAYFTNNSGSSRQQLYSKLTGMGFKLKISEVYNSGYAAAAFAKNLGLNRVYCFGSTDLREDLEGQGIITCKRTDNIDAIIIGLDRDLTYTKLATALNKYKPGVKLIACNRDRSFPIENGTLMPGCGSIVAALEVAIGKTADFVVGKPNTFIMDIISQDFKVQAESILIVGDTEETDIEMASRFGCSSVLIREGAAIPSKASKTIRRLSELLDYIDVLNGDGVV